MHKALHKLSQKPFSTKEALKRGLSKPNLTSMIEHGVLERLSRGVYQVTDTALNSQGFGDGTGWGMGSGSGTGRGDGSGGGEYTDLEKSYISASIRCATPSAVCLLSALEYYHLTGEITAQVWMMVPETKRVVSKDIKLLRCRDPQWKIGIEKHKDYWITTIERTLIDCVIYKKIVGSQVALEALKKAVGEKKVKLGKLYDLAKKMGVAHRLQPYIEILGS